MIKRRIILFPRGRGTILKAGKRTSPSVPTFPMMGKLFVYDQSRPSGSLLGIPSGKCAVGLPVLYHQSSV